MGIKYIEKLYRNEIFTRGARRKRTLTGRQEAFLFNYLVMRQTATQAAYNAGYCPRYASQAAAQVLKSINVAAYIGAYYLEYWNSFTKGISVYSTMLNNRERAFVDYWLIYADAKKAAIKAGYKRRYAKQYGHELLQKPKMQKAILERIKSCDEKEMI
jgi:phage terminase small subunit